MYNKGHSITTNGGGPSPSQMVPQSLYPIFWGWKRGFFLLWWLAAFFMLKWGVATNSWPATDNKTPASPLNESAAIVVSHEMKGMGTWRNKSLVKTNNAFQQNFSERKT